MYHQAVRKRIEDEIRERGLLKPGDRVGVAVSGGADSVALLHALTELRTALGIIVSVLHFHHGIRGAAADADETFVAELAGRLGVKCELGRGDTPTHAKGSSQSLETAARELRYRFFESVLRSGAVDKIATAHTMDDQAETVLMRTLRGAGPRGLSGIHAERDAGRFIRPMLRVRRREVEKYLRSLRQEWREDESNLERKHFRNQVRHDLIPVLERDFNPNVVDTLARNAEVAQGEEEYWQSEVARLLPLVRLPGKPTRGGGRSSSHGEKSVALNVEVLSKYPIAVQRRVLLATARDQGIDATFRHIETLVGLARAKGPATELPGGWRAVRGLRELRLEPVAVDIAGLTDYEHELPVPGETGVEEISLLVQARLEPIASGDEGYNSGEVPGELRLSQDWKAPLTVRNWRLGDRFWPGQSKCQRKVKEILQQLKVPARERESWPVVVAGEELVWVRGARQRPVRIQRGGQDWSLVIAATNL